jgi:hypothetical protein
LLGRGTRHMHQRFDLGDGNARIRLR